MNIKHTIFNLLVLLFISSCSFLDEYSQNEFKPTTTEDFDDILTGGGYANNVLNFIPYYDLLTDDIGTYSVPYTNGEKTVQDMQQITNCFPYYEWNPEMFNITEVENKITTCNSWAKLYELIKNCNVVLNSVDESAGPKDRKEYLKAQALGLRAFYYYLLVNLYSDPYNSGNPSEMRGVPLIKNFSVDARYPVPATVKGVYDFMLEDIHLALNLMEQYKPTVKTSVTRVSAPMLHTLAARIYMQMDEWVKVIDHSEKVLSEKKTLIKLSEFLTGTNNGTYTADSRPYRWSSAVFSGKSYEPAEFIWGYSSKLNWSDFFNDAGNPKYKSRPFGVSAELKGLYDIDLEYYVPPGASGPIVKHFFGDVRYFAYFFHGGDSSWFMYYGTKEASAKSTIFGMRTSESYLNLAEALIRTGKSPEAFVLLNTLRESRWKGEYIQLYPQSKEKDLEFCLEERRRELAFEHIRWFDLRRLGRPRLVHKILYEQGQTDETVLEQGDPRYTLPIPQSVKDRNPELN